MSSSDNDQLIQQIRDALTHLYDYAYLQRHPLANAVVLSQAATTRTRAQELRRILLDAIECLNPGDNIPIRALERRGYAILFGLYVEGGDRKEVANSLGISGRQLRRDRGTAFEALASILQDRYFISTPADALPMAEPLPSESEWLTRQREPVDLSDLVSGLLPLLERMASERNVRLISHVELNLPRLYINRTLLRQTLISLANHLLANLPLTRLSFETQAAETVIRVGLNLRYRPEYWQKNGERPPLTSIIKPVETLVEAMEARVEQTTVRHETETLWLILPQEAEKMVLVVDDNQELFALFQRYVAGQPYRLVHAAGVEKALDLIRATRPDIITLDLMMPNRDGWDMLQTLRSNPDTAHIPVAVCSILADEDLAFAWGAQIYLKKPVGAVEFLQALSRAESL